MCFNKDSRNLSFICYFTIKLVNGTNEYFLTTYYIWHLKQDTKEHKKEPNTKHEDNYEHKDVEEDEHKNAVP
jgi:hypothetical protein